MTFHSEITPMFVRKSLVAMALVAFAGGAMAQSLGMQSDWLETVKGHRDGKTGAQVMEVMEDPKTGQQAVMVKIPKSSMEDDSDMEEIKVVGQAPGEREMPEVLPELETQWVDDYDNDHYGLLVKFNEDQKTPFRLFFSMQGQGQGVGAVSP